MRLHFNASESIRMNWVGFPKRCHILAFVIYAAKSLKKQDKIHINWKPNIRIDSSSQLGWFSWHEKTNDERWPSTRSKGTFAKFDDFSGRFQSWIVQKWKEVVMENVTLKPNELSYKTCYNKIESFWPKLSFNELLSSLNESFNISSNARDSIKCT